MASVQIRTKRGEYYAFFRNRTGKRICRNTRTRDKGEALRIAKFWEEEADKAHGPSTSAVSPPVVLEDSKFSKLKCQTWTQSSRYQASKGYFRFVTDAEFPVGEQPGSCLADVPTPKEDSLQIAAQWRQFLEYRLPMLERQVRELGELDEQEESIANSLPLEITQREPMQRWHIPSPEEHAATLEKAWQEVISRREKAAWGIMTLTLAGHIKVIPVDALDFHSTTPSVPTRRTGQELVLVIRDPRTAGTEYQCEGRSEISAGKRIQAARFDLGLPEYSARLLDQPFETLEFFCSEIGRMIDLQGGERALSQAQEWKIRDFHDNAANCLKRAYSLLANEPLDPLLRKTAWMSFTSQFISATSAYAEARSTLNEDQERRARASMKLDDQKSKGRGKDKARSELIQVLASHRREGRSRREALEKMMTHGYLKFNRRKNPDLESPTLFWIKRGKAWKGPKSFKTLERYWTEACSIPAR